MDPGLMTTTSSAEINEIAKALARAQLKISGAEKDRQNPHFKQHYATLASVWDACHVALNENDIAIVQAPAVTPDGQQILVTILAHGSGQWFRGEYRLSPAKNDPQGMGSAVTYARRYSLSCMTGVAPKDDDDDGNAAANGYDQQSQQQQARRQDEPEIGVETAAKVLAAFGDIGVTREQLKAKLGCEVQHAPQSRLEQLKTWRNMCEANKGSIVTLFGPREPSGAAALNEKLGTTK